MRLLSFQAKREPGERKAKEKKGKEEGRQRRRRRTRTQVLKSSDLSNTRIGLRRRKGIVSFSMDSFCCCLDLGLFLVAFNDLNP